MYKYDVVIIGGGVSGAIAGIACARTGAKTLIIEKMGFLGGMLTAGGVGPMMTFHAGNVQVIRGIAEEVVQRLVDLGGSPGHIIDSTGYTYTVTPFDPELLKHVLEEMYHEAGGEILYHSFFTDVEVEGGRIKSVSAATKSGIMKFCAKVFIDASGDGDVAAAGGVEFVLGREKDNLCQPLTMNMRVYNVDIEQIKECIRKDPDDFPNVDVNLIDKAPRLSAGGFDRLLRKARERGEINIPREFILFFETNNPGELIINTTRVVKVNPTDAWELSKAETEGRRQALQLFNFMKREVPGFRNSVLAYTGPNIGVRESRKIKGKYTLTAEDLANEVKFEDEIACSGYPIDIHSPEGSGTNSRIFEWGSIYGVPYRCLINERISNLIIVGRCISATHEANAAIRTTPLAMAIGHAGGIAAGLAAQKGCSAAEVDYRELRNELLKGGAFLR